MMGNEFRNWVNVTNKIEKSKLAGTFTVSSGKDVYGELTLAGHSTSLYLQDKDYFDAIETAGQCVKGVLHDLTKVTLIQCIPTEGTGYSSRGGQSYSFARIFPHYVVYGNHIDPAEKEITGVHFVVDDAATLFYDFDTFGFLSDARPFIKQIADANTHGREIAIGPHPYILYFTGKSEIFASDTVLGRVSASHVPIPHGGGPRGVGLKNTILVTIVFGEAVTFNDSIDHMLALVRYLEILIGRPQNLFNVHIDVESDGEQSTSLQVYWSMAPKREPSHEEKSPQPRDVLLNGGLEPAEFSRVLGSWLGRQQAWHKARMSFSTSFAKQRYYTIARLTGSTNMFDILPSSAVPLDVELSEELKGAKDECSTIFKKLPQSLERDSVLNALGRIGKSTLKHKIRHRAQILIETVGERFPDLFTVTDEAVNCRNHYVHGSEPKFDYNANFDAVTFFTDTSEFVFAASDLIEAGWNIKAWIEAGTTMSHPFGRYYVNYFANLRNLKNLMDGGGSEGK